MNRYLSILSFALLLLGTSCKDEVVNYSDEQNVLMRGIIGEILASESSRTFVDGRAHTNYEIECGSAGTYYLSTWMEIPLINDELLEYEVKINGVLSENTFKPGQTGFQTLLLTDHANSPSPVLLEKGKNIITLVSVGREILNVGEFKVSTNLEQAQIDDSEYQNYISQLLVSPVTINSGSLTRGATTTQSDQIYDYVLDLPSTYTYTQTMYMEDYMYVKITTSSNDFPHVVEFYNKYYSFSAYGTSSATLEFITPDYWGDYTLRIRALEPGTNGVVDFNYYEEWQGIPLSRNYTNVVAGGNTVNMNRSLSDYYILSHSTIESVFNRLTLVGPDNKFIMNGSYKRVYPNVESFSDAQDLSIYYGHEAYLKYAGTVEKCYVTSSYMKNQPVAVDVYMGLEPCSSTILNYFPNAPWNNTFRSAPNTGVYNCISWSVERTDYWEWPGSVGSSYYHSDLLTAFDQLYAAYGYTRSGATAENAGIALWGTSNSDLTHASVTKNANTTKPHGFAWESKCGALERVMHEKEALNGNSYGTIRYYYRPVNDVARAAIMPQDVVENINLSSVSALNASLKANVSMTRVSEFENKYSAWKKTWANPELAIHSNPKKYAMSSEYAELLNFCQTYGKSTWPLFVEKLIDGDVLVTNLIDDLTISDNISLMEGVKAAAINARSANAPLPSMYSNYVNYCEKLLTENEAQIKKQSAKRFNY